MRINELIFGTEEEKNARQTVETLSSKKNLSKQERSRLKKATETTKQRVQRLMTAGGICLITGTAGAAGYAMWRDDHQERTGSSQTSPDQKTADPISASTGAGEKIDSPSPEKIHDLYERGFSRIMSKLPAESGKSQSPGIKILQDIKKFRDERVRWATIAGDTFYAQEYGTNNSAWLAVIPPGHQLNKTQDMTLSVSTNFGPPILTIKAAEISDEWAGLGLTHETSHLRDLTLGLEDRNAGRDEYLKGEVKAYEAEMAAADMISNGNFSKNLDSIIAKYGFRSYQEVHDAFTGKGDLVRQLNTGIDASISNAPVKSNNEREIRDGFYPIAIFYRTIDQNNKDPGTRLKLKIEVTGLVYKR